MAPAFPKIDPMKSLDELLTLLDLERLEVNLFRGVSPNDGLPRVYGGQVVAQSLMAAYRTVQNRVCHSLHCYFIRPGDPSIPIIYEVDNARDGTSFTTRRVIAIQHGKQIFNMAASFQVKEGGYEHQIDMPAHGDPDKLPQEPPPADDMDNPVRETMKVFMNRNRPVQMLPGDWSDLAPAKALPPKRQIWMRATGPIGEDHVLQHCVLAYVSDFALLDTSTRPHSVNWFRGGVQMASLDHAVWFHQPFCMEDWLLYDMDSPIAHGGRGFNRGQVFTRDGVLVASVAQEGLIRPQSE